MRKYNISLKNNMILLTLLKAININYIAIPPSTLITSPVI